jgi:hypothetical protein
LFNLLKGIIHALINYFVTIYTINKSIDDEGHDSNLWVISAVLYTNILLIVSIDMEMFTQYHTWINIAVLAALTFLMYILFLIVVENINIFTSTGTMKYTFNSGLVWMNFILISGFCGLIDFCILIFKQFFVKRISNLVKLLKKKDDISYEYIKTMPEELQNLLLIDDRVKEFNKNKEDFNDNNSNLNLKIENLNNDENNKNNNKDINNKESIDIKNQPINLILDKKNNEDNKAQNQEKHMVNVMRKSAKPNLNIKIKKKKKKKSMPNPNPNFKENEGSDITKEENENKIMSKRQSSRPFGDIRFGLGNKNVKSSNNKIKEQSKNINGTTRREFLIDKKFLK